MCAVRGVKSGHQAVVIDPLSVGHQRIDDRIECCKSAATVYESGRSAGIGIGVLPYDRFLVVNAEGELGRRGGVDIERDAANTAGENKRKGAVLSHHCWSDVDGVCG